MMMWAIATCVQNDYSLNMRLFALRRWFALCAVVALSMGLVAQGFAAADMDAKMMTAAAWAMSRASGGCAGCGGDDGMPGPGCLALCGGTVPVLQHVAPPNTMAAVRTNPLVAPP